MIFKVRFKGGPGSGHHGHSGRPGKHGGSLPGTGSGTNNIIDSFVVDAFGSILDDPKLRKLAAGYMADGDVNGIYNLTFTAASAGVAEDDINELARKWEAGEDVPADVKHVFDELQSDFLHARFKDGDPSKGPNPGWKAPEDTGATYYDDWDARMDLKAMIQDKFGDEYTQTIKNPNHPRGLFLGDDNLQEYLREHNIKPVTKYMPFVAEIQHSNEVMAMWESLQPKIGSVLEPGKKLPTRRRNWEIEHYGKVVGGWGPANEFAIEELHNHFDKFVPGK